MNLYSLLLALHIVVCILGVGGSTYLALLAGSPNGSIVELTHYRLVVRAMTRSLAFVVLSGAILVALKNEGQAEHWWFRLAVLLTFTIGALMGTSLRSVPKEATHLNAAQLLKLRGVGWIAAGLTATIVFLIEGKPF